MARNYVEAVLRVVGRDERIDAVLDILASEGRTAIEKWNAIETIDLAGVHVSDFIMLAFAAGRNRERGLLEKEIGKLFS